MNREFMKGVTAGISGSYGAVAFILYTEHSIESSQIGYFIGVCITVMLAGSLLIFVKRDKVSGDD